MDWAMEIEFRKWARVPIICLTHRSGLQVTLSHICHQFVGVVVGYLWFIFSECEAEGGCTLSPSLYLSHHYLPLSFPPTQSSSPYLSHPIIASPSYSLPPTLFDSLVRYKFRSQCSGHFPTSTGYETLPLRYCVLCPLIIP